MNRICFCFKGLGSVMRGQVVGVLHTCKWNTFWGWCSNSPFCFFLHSWQKLQRRGRVKEEKGGGCHVLSGCCWKLPVTQEQVIIGFERAHSWQVVWWCPTLFKAFKKRSSTSKSMLTFKGSQYRAVEHLSNMFLVMVNSWACIVWYKMLSVTIWITLTFGLIKVCVSAIFLRWNILFFFLSPWWSVSKSSNLDLKWHQDSGLIHIVLLDNWSSVLFFSWGLIEGFLFLLSFKFRMHVWLWGLWVETLGQFQWANIQMLEPFISKCKVSNIHCSFCGTWCILTYGCMYSYVYLFVFNIYSVI